MHIVLAGIGNPRLHNSSPCGRLVTLCGARYHRSSGQLAPFWRALGRGRPSPHQPVATAVSPSHQHCSGRHDLCPGGGHGRTPAVPPSGDRRTPPVPPSGDRRTPRPPPLRRQSHPCGPSLRPQAHPCGPSLRPQVGTGVCCRRGAGGPAG